MCTRNKILLYDISSVEQQMWSVQFLTNRNNLGTIEITMTRID